MTNKLYEAEVETRQALLNENARLRERITELERGEPVAWSTREIELIDGMIKVQTHHAERAKIMANIHMGKQQAGWDMERVELLKKVKLYAAPPAQEQVAIERAILVRVQKELFPGEYPEAPHDRYARSVIQSALNNYPGGVCCTTPPAAQEAPAAPDTTPETDALEQKQSKELSAFSGTTSEERDIRSRQDMERREATRTLERQRNALRARLAKVEPEARRYRRMRENAAFQDRGGPMLYWYVPRYNHDLPLGERLDAAIDAAWPERKES